MSTESSASSYWKDLFVEWRAREGAWSARYPADGGSMFFIQNAMSGNFALENLKKDYGEMLGRRKCSDLVAKLRILQDKLIGWEDLEEIFAFRQKLESSGSDQHSDEDGVLEDVYQAAIFLLIDPTKRNNVHGQFRFRGQCSADWELKPSIYRSMDPRVCSMLRDDLEAFVHEVLKDTRYSKEQAEAIGQHYDVKSNYIDVSTDLLVALFFSTHGRTSEEKIGVVQMLVKREWEGIFKRDIREVHLDEVLHIRNQRGSFITGSHPELFAQYVSWETKFHHKDGLFFEDPARGIVTDFIYPPKDGHKDLVKVWSARAWEGGATFPPRPILEKQPYDPLVPLAAEDYLLWIRRYYEDNDGELGNKTRDDAWKPALMKLCRFHTALQHPSIKKEIPLHMRSLNRLSTGVAALLCDPANNVTDAWGRHVVQGYLSHALGNDEATRLLELAFLEPFGGADDVGLDCSKGCE